MSAVETLMTEHRLIEQTLSALQQYGQAVAAGDGVPVGDAQAFAAFFHDFADKCHHGKEEDILFEQMAAAGFSKESGPIGMMLYEHDEGRNHVRALAQIDGQSEWTDDLRKTVAGHISAFVPLLLGHIQKEDTILYPMASSRLAGDTMDKITADCTAFDAGNMNGAAYEHYSTVANDFCSRYPIG